ncbi:MAG TPA: 2OG-Fe(II) oxygenase [Porticoccaceae bacterium]|nr:2OG-Fe(II) oxygenase [Porticoccaceae bacterium]HIK79418.1 2OG-Fe(II) oxygenase [Porticoccaceae bacterium]
MAPNHLADIVDLKQCPIESKKFRERCRATLAASGALVIDNFLTASAIASIKDEGHNNQHLAYYTDTTHNIYLKPSDPQYPADHPRNREVNSSKGCITTDQIPLGSALCRLYDTAEFRDFLCAVLEEPALYEYADPMSSINLHYASEGQELGWHFDNSSFAITLLIEKPDGGGGFEYVKDVRDADSGEMNYSIAEQVLNGEVETQSLSIEPGALVLFRGRDSMHRVTPTVGDVTRMLVVLAYNTEPNIALSESARMTFFGRLGD